MATTNITLTGVAQFQHAICHP